MTPQAFKALLAGLTGQIANRPLDTALQTWLNTEHGATSPLYAQLKAACKAGVTDGWYRWVGANGRVCGMDTFGKSAPAPELFRLFGFTPEHVAGLALELLAT